MPRGDAGAGGPVVSHKLWNQNWMLKARNSDDMSTSLPVTCEHCPRNTLLQKPTILGFLGKVDGS
ncbi:hypothetical protein PAXINDRAFT_172705 [Paxillus involutus ATCC 200175]|uniref:Uncharacterized protein n=1 Tax=Paxillus involutus ATCC 200175 TaxID=664439 RepID=A0A0C9TD41_PAXIN|nr:hypothetical protein PAXINDRAFT_172705 [Paxillus involutus ATCC 200175]